MNPKILEMIKCCSTIFSGFSSPCPADDKIFLSPFSLKFSSKFQETEIMISWKGLVVSLSNVADNSLRKGGICAKLVSIFGSLLI